ncbi:protein FAM151B [Halichoeres trimaculatus]|uniref:protein FAM151B n=1 Tax=Halichoeres trimaculatus TaxID=147232 RepID=UPI003D9E6E84
MTDRTLDYFISRMRTEEKDGAEIRWGHAVNSRSRLTEALTDPTHMLEADIVIRGHDPREPIMAHPPKTDSDITLREWLQAVKEHDKGIKLDFKSLDAVSPSVLLLQEVLQEDMSESGRPVWLNADILSGPGGQATPLDAQSFLSAVRTLPTHIVLSLGWTTGWTAGMQNPGYTWEMMHTMEDICRTLQHPVTFPVRAALMAQSVPQLTWLLQQSDRYSLTVWTWVEDEFDLQDLRLFRKQFDISRIYFDLPESQRTQLTVKE